MSSLAESARAMARKTAEKKEEVITEAYPGEGKNKQEKPLPQGSSVTPKVEPLYKGSGAAKGVKTAAPLAPKVKAFQDKPLKQGSSQDAPIVDVDSKDVGRIVSAKAKKDTTLPAGNGAGKAPNFKTVKDPTKHVGASTGTGNTFQEPGNHGPVNREEVESDEVIEMTDEEFDALTPEEQAELVPIADDEEVSEEVVEEEVLDEKLKADKSKKEKSEEKEGNFKKKLSSAKEGLELDVKSVFAEDTDLSEEAKTKMASLFEAAVAARTAIEVEAIKESLADEALDMLEEHKAALTEQVDAYLTATANEWLAENEVAVVGALKSEITEGVLEGLKKVFEDNYINVPEDKLDVLADMKAQIEALEDVITEQDEETAQLAEALVALKKDAVIAEVAEGLAATEQEKFNKVIADVSFEDEASYKEKLGVIKENYFRKKTKVVEGVEVLDDEPVREEPTGRMAKYLSTLKSSAKNRG